MYKVLAVSAVILMTALSTVSAKCDAMKEFKPEVEDIVAWAKARCDANPDLTDADLKKAHDCYDKNIKKHLTSANGKAVDGFVNNMFKDPNTKKVCKDSKAQDNIKKKAMKDIGITKAMACKKEVEANCPEFKKALNDFTVCAKK